MSMKYIRDIYGVPAKRGRRVQVRGGRYNKHPTCGGVITGSNAPYLVVRLDGETGGKLFHPFDVIWAEALTTPGTFRRIMEQAPAGGQ